MVKKRVGILTFYNAHNYGAVLQCYALKKKIEDLNMQCDIICYQNKVISMSYPEKRKFKLKSKSKKGILMAPIDIINFNYSKSMYHEKWKKFNSFISLLTNNSKDVYTSVDEMANINYDYIICGSDQVWNPMLTEGLDRAYFAGFETRAKKISYAASMGLKSLEGEDEKEFFNLLDNFDFISVREESLKKYIEKNSKVKAEVVVDPTLLIEESAYKDIIKMQDENKKYILVYCLMENRKMVSLAKKMAKEKNLEVIEIRFFKDITYFNDNQRADLGVEEFLGYIKGAEMIICNSFHGTVFSMIFNKPFYTIPLGKVSSRMENLLNKAGLIERLRNIDGEFSFNEKIDYVKVNEKLEKAREKSIDFLKKALS